MLFNRDFINAIVSFIFAGVHSVLCKLPDQTDGTGNKSHYHCPSCFKTVRRKIDMRLHMAKCKNVQHGVEKDHERQNTSERQVTSQRQVTSLDHDYGIAYGNDRKRGNKGKKSLTEQQQTEKRQCSNCGKYVNRKWMKHHIKTHEKKQITAARHNFSVRIDPNQGIYCSAKSIKGRFIPVHLIKKTSGTSPYLFCEELTCIEKKQTAERGGNISFECEHIRSAEFAVPGTRVELNTDVLNCLVESGFISENRATQILTLRDNCLSHNCAFVVEIPNPPESSSRFIYLSVYSGTQRYWSRIDRTIVCIDTDKNVVSCKCSKTKIYCSHKALAKWYLKQERPQFFQTSQTSILEEIGFDNDESGQYAEIDDEDGDDVAVDESAKDTEELESITGDTISTDPVLSYTMRKRIPVDVTVVSNVRVHEVIPEEKRCHLCNDHLTRVLSSKAGKLVTMSGVVTGNISLFCVFLQLNFNH